MHGETVKSV